MYKFIEISKDLLIDKKRYLVVGSILGMPWSDKMTYYARNDMFGGSGYNIIQKVKEQSEVKVYQVELQATPYLDIPEVKKKEGEF